MARNQVLGSCGGLVRKTLTDLNNVSNFDIIGLNKYLWRGKTLPMAKGKE